MSADRRSQLAAAGQADPVDLALSTMAVTAVALAQPLLDLLGRSPEFFVAHGSPPLDVVLLALGLALGIPTLLTGVVLLVFRLSRGAGRALHAGVMVSMGALLAVTVLKATRLSTLPGWTLIAIALLIGSLLAWGFHRVRGVRLTLRYASIAPLVVAGAFLVIAPASRLAWAAQPAGVETATTIADEAPVVMIVFDEFPVAALIDTQGDIRSDQFPNYARLADDGIWFRNAVGVHERTEQALPTIVSGVVAPLEGKVPRAADYPQTLFSLLGGTYTVSAHETVTELCPVAVCGEASHPRISYRWSSLLRDLSVVSAHVFLPADLVAWAPPIDQTWGNYDGTAPAGDWGINQRFLGNVDADRRATIASFINGVDHPLASNELHFAHLLVPHSPWTYLPDGRSYETTGYPSGDDGIWGNDSWAIAQMRQRHLLQVQYTDTVIGEVIATLARNGSYDDALIVVVADHGISIRPGYHYRIVDDRNSGEVMAVPLFVKLPNQQPGGVDDYRAETTDIVPTIADVIGAEIPWQVDGTSLIASTRPERTESTMIGSEGNVTIGVGGGEKLEAARYHAANFGDRGPFGLAPPGRVPLLSAELSGLPVEPAAQGEVEIDGSYIGVDLAADRLPALLTGTISGAGPVDLAIAFNGRIVAVTRSAGSGAFSAMIPPENIAEDNQVEFFVVEGTGSEPTLAPAGSEP